MDHAATLDVLYNTKWGDIPEPAQRWAQICLLDLIGVGLGGATTPLSGIIRDHAAEDFSGKIPMLFDGRPVSPQGAALAGGMTIDALDAHDGYNPAKGHAGCGLLPALYAIWADTGAHDGPEFLTQLALGYEFACRFAVAQHDTCPDYHTSGAWVAVAIAAIAARHYGLPRAQAHHAMGIAEYHGPRSQMMRVIDHPTMLKDGSGWGAMCGVSAVRLAMRGFTGAPAITLDTPHWGDLGHNWLVTQQYFKPYPVCRWAQGPVAAILDLKAKHGFTADDVTKIEIWSFDESVRLGQKLATTTEQAQYSTSVPCALALIHGTVAPDHITAQALADPAVLRLSKALVMHSDDYANSVFPTQRPAKAAITMRDGTRYESDYHIPEWDPANPPSFDALRRKYHAYATPVVGATRAKAIEHAVDTLPQNGPQALFELLCQPINR